MTEQQIDQLRRVQPEHVIAKGMAVILEGQVLNVRIVLKAHAGETNLLDLHPSGGTTLIQ
jgi:hypothetical protein